MASPVYGNNKDSNVLNSKMKKESDVKDEKESVLLDPVSDSHISKNVTTETALPDDNGSLKTTSSASQKPKSTVTGSVSSVVDNKSSHDKPQKSSSQSNLVKNLANEVKEMKVRIRKLEDEVSTLHEVSVYFVRNTTRNPVISLTNVDF